MSMILRWITHVFLTGRREELQSLPFFFCHCLVSVSCLLILDQDRHYIPSCRLLLMIAHMMLFKHHRFEIDSPHTLESSKLNMRLQKVAHNHEDYYDLFPTIFLHRAFKKISVFPFLIYSLTLLSSHTILHT